MQRCVLFGLAQPIAGGIAVRRRIPPVAARHLARMPEHLQAAHPAFARRTSAGTAHEMERACRLVDVMVEVGDDPDVVERQLLGLGVSPATALAALSTRERTSAGFRPDAA